MMLKKSLIIAVIGFFLLSAVALSSPGVFGKFDYFVKDKTEINFYSACTYYNLTAPGTGKVAVSDINTITIDKYTQMAGTIKGSGYWEFLELKNDSVEKGYYDCKSKPCEWKLHNTTVINEVWHPMAKYTKDYKAEKQKIQARFCAKFSREITDDGWSVSIDHIPQYKNIKYPEYAWWNDTYPYKRTIIGNNLVANVPVTLNQSNWTLDNRKNITWFTWTATGEDVYYNDTAPVRYTIANDTEEFIYQEEYTLNVATEYDSINTSKGCKAFSNDLLMVIHGDFYGGVTGEYFYSRACRWNTEDNVWVRRVSASSNIAAGGVYGNKYSFENDGGSYLVNPVSGSDLPASWADTMNGTIELWVSFADADGQHDSADASQIKIIEGKQTGGWEGSPNLDFPAASGCVKFWIANSVGGENVSVTSTTCNFTTDTWYHIGANWNSTGTYLFVNGVNEANDTSQGVGGVWFEDNKVGVGDDEYSVDELRIWNNSKPHAYFSAVFQGYTTLSSQQTPAGDVEILSPLNKTYAVTNTSLEYNAIDDMDKCWYSLNLGQTNTTIIGCGNTTFLAIEGNNTVRLYINNTSGDTSNDDINFTVDTQYPNITIDHPTNTTYETNYLDLNLTVADASIDKCWYRKNDTESNISFGNCSNAKVTFLVGFNELWVWVNDTAGNENSSTVNFTVSDLNLTNMSIQDFTSVTTGSSLTIWANYTNRTTGESIKNADCSATGDLSGDLTYDTTNSRYERVVTAPAVKSGATVTIICNLTGYETRQLTDTFDVTSGATTTVGDGGGGGGGVSPTTTSIIPECEPGFIFDEELGKCVQAPLGTLPEIELNIIEFLNAETLFGIPNIYILSLVFVIFGILGASRRSRKKVKNYARRYLK